MKIIDRLDEEAVAKLNDLKMSNSKGHQKYKRRNKNKQERLTRRDIEELMDINRPTYKRGKGGVIRQR